MADAQREARSWKEAEASCSWWGKNEGPDVAARMLERPRAACIVGTICFAG